jgi:2-hydroxychromene-2-carboxylate isomerase
MKAIDYFYVPQSPWTYLGHQRFWQMARKAGANIRLKPMDLGRVFPVSGGLPLGQRAPQRQAYRLVELKRFSQALDMPMNIQPKYFPVAGNLAAQLIIAADLQHGSPAAMNLAGAVLRAVWAQERDIADAQVLAQLLDECKLDPACLAHASSNEVQQHYDDYTQQAIDLGVFGAPSYVIDGEIFWGQDRLDFVEKALA